MFNEKPEKHKTIEFQADVDNFKNKSGVVTVQISAVSDKVDKNLLAEIMDAGGTTITIEANQTELVDDDQDEAEGQTELLED